MKRTWMRTWIFWTVVRAVIAMVMVAALRDESAVIAGIVVLLAFSAIHWETCAEDDREQELRLARAFDRWKDGDRWN